LRMGDILLAVGGGEVKDLAGLYRGIWRCGSAGAKVPIVVYRDGRTIELEVKSADRSSFLKSPSLH
jgi:S1-C subfamily serine protease